MGIELQCWNCGRPLTAANSMAGRTTRCPRCDASLRVPELPPSMEETATDLGEPEPPPLNETAFAEPLELVEEPPPPVKKKPAARAPIFPTPPVQQDHDLIDMTAMVDIVFFLLIFFLVTSMQAIEAVLPMPKPEQSVANAKAQSTAQLLENPYTVVITIEEDDSILVDEVKVFGDTELLVALRELRKQSPAEPSVVIMGSPDATHGAAVRVLDACATAQLTNVRLLVDADEEG